MSKLNSWEWSWDARGTKHREGENEDHDLSSAIEGTAQEVVVFAVPSRMVAAQPELRRQPYENAREDGGCHPCELERTGVSYQRSAYSVFALEDSL
jgi:hypothetical protein